ncbi:GNAT family N-acetyltransferase [Glaciibacter flavus]|uniref:GNAT family N-acetyltransferase n=1 Tax=Orlajensenia flava TaxID=2565934 RepID=UPI003AFFFF26
MSDAASVNLQPMTRERLAVWLPDSMAQYEQSRIDAGDSPAAAAANRRASEERLFPDGEPAPGQLLFSAMLDGREAGWLWVGPFAEGADWWVWHVEVHEEFRRRGLGRVIMQRAEEIAREHGASSLGLNVFAYNTGARALYESLGYETTAINMKKTWAD